MEGWSKIKGAAKYAGISERSFRDWLKAGLKHSRLPTGTILVRFADVDQFLEGFSVNQKEADRIVEEILDELCPRTGRKANAKKRK